MKQTIYVLNQRMEDYEGDWTVIYAVEDREEAENDIKRMEERDRENDWLDWEYKIDEVDLFAKAEKDIYIVEQLSCDGEHWEPQFAVTNEKKDWELIRQKRKYEATLRLRKITLYQ